MDALRKFPQLLYKYKYAVLVLLVGIVLMLIPTQKSESLDKAETTKPMTNVTEELNQILAQVDGVGNVRVMLTLSVGERVVFQTDEDGNVVIVTNSDRTEAGLIQSIHSPVYQGAIVVCQGADRASVRLAVVEAVANITGLATDKISVLKMK